MTFCNACLPALARHSTCTGTLEEKVFQRQLSKEGLSNVVNQSGKSAASHMSTEDLADLFTPEFDSFSSTYESLVADKSDQGDEAAEKDCGAVVPSGPVHRGQVRIRAAP
jgi:hypothetical protein